MAEELKKRSRRSAFWRAASGGLIMLTALVLVWAILASVTAFQRGQENKQLRSENNQLKMTMKEWQSPPQNPVEVELDAE